MPEKIKETLNYIRNKTNFIPELGIILGSGLGGLVKKLKVEYELNYSEIPNFPVSTVQGHGSKLFFGTIGSKKVVVMQGRFHFYEGYTMNEVGFPVRVLKLLGIQKLILSNASGGMNLNYQVGDIVIIEDHINLMSNNPLIGKNEEEFGPRFPDMSHPYDREMINKAKTIADKLGFRNHTGVYAAVTGPTFETPAEYRFMRIIGADIVGMSTVPEVIVARHMNLPCFAISIVTDLGGHPEIKPISHEEVLKVASEAEIKMTQIVEQLIAG